MQIYLHLGMEFSVRRRRGEVWQPASFFYGIDHAWAIKTRAVCSSLGGLQGGDDEAAESGTEMVVRLGVLRGWGMVAEMPAVLAARAEPTGWGVGQKGRREHRGGQNGTKVDNLARRWTKWQGWKGWHGDCNIQGENV